MLIYLCGNQLSTFINYAFFFKVNCILTSFKGNLILKICWFWCKTYFSLCNRLFLVVVFCHWVKWSPYDLLLNHLVLMSYSLLVIFEHSTFLDLDGKREVYFENRERMWCVFFAQVELYWWEIRSESCAVLWLCRCDCCLYKTLLCGNVLFVSQTTAVTWRFPELNEGRGGT